jgi:hypothetical protein
MRHPLRRVLAGTAGSAAVILTAWRLAGAAEALPVAGTTASASGLVQEAQARILSDRPISEGLERPSIGGNRMPDMLLRPDTRTEIIERRQIISPQREVCRTDPVYRRTSKGTVVEQQRRCWLVPGRGVRN